MDETKEQAVVNRGQEHPLGRQTIRRDSLEHRLVAADTSGYRSGWGYIRVSGKTGATTRCNIKGHIQNGTVCFVLFARNMHTVYFANVKQGGYFKFTAGRKFYGTFCSRAHNEKEEEHEKRIFRRWNERISPCLVKRFSPRMDTVKDTGDCIRRCLWKSYSKTLLLAYINNFEYS